MRRLTIDGKWTIEYDETNNDRPVELYRYDAPRGVDDWRNDQTAMFHALLERHETLEKMHDTLRAIAWIPDVAQAQRLAREALNISPEQAISQAPAAPGQPTPVQPPAPREMASAPRDGTMLRLLVNYVNGGAHPFEDADEAWTIGFNNCDGTGEDLWEFAGWDWCQDCFINGVGTPIGWLPFLSKNGQPMVEALQEIATQKKASEMGREWADVASFEDGYDMCIDRARAALKAVDNG